MTLTPWKLGAAAAVAALATTVAMTVPAEAVGSVARMHEMRTHGAGHSASSGGPLIDHGGKVLPTSHTYAIFWGNQSAWASDVQDPKVGIPALLGGFNGSSYLGISGQYMRGASISSTYVGSKVDTSNPARRVSASTLGNEVLKLYGSNLDTNGIYFVYTSNFPSGGSFCAWHSDANVGGKTIQVAYMPNTTNVAGCNPGNNYNLSGSESLRSLANVTAHEFSEAVTDPTISAWYDGSGSEIGDKCAWTFGGAVTLSNGTKWQLQNEWSNAINGCTEG